MNHYTENRFGFRDDAIYSFFKISAIKNFSGILNLKLNLIFHFTSVNKCLNIITLHLYVYSLENN